MFHKLARCYCTESSVWPNGSRFNHLQCWTFSFNNILPPVFDPKASCTYSRFVILMVFLTLDSTRVLFQVLTFLVNENSVAKEGLRILWPHFLFYFVSFKSTFKIRLLITVAQFLGQKRKLKYPKKTKQSYSNMIRYTGLLCIACFLYNGSQSKKS